MKSTREMIEVMEAYERGEQIECRSLMGDVWSLLPTPLWDWQGCDYRVKPEPKLRPWKPEEVPLGAVVRDKKDGAKGLIVAVSEEAIEIGQDGYYDFDELLKYYVLDDHSPCGVEE